AVGQELARVLGMNYLDTDELIEKTEKLSINDIFARHGETYFRELETKVIKTLQEHDNFVISTGGGIVLRPENVKMLKAIGPLVLLWADPETVYDRMKKETQRPLLKVEDPKAEIKNILDKRTPVYDRAADYKIDTSRMTVEEAVNGVVKWLKLKSI
ncbi:MAG: shikimate kinase, partial [Candidatus Margulisbacteria bacterium]|nr:shikimate kinase [Candidatus Margulisiibacteriota bacterium]